jgi:hypothetical protein
MGTNCTAKPLIHLLLIGLITLLALAGCGGGGDGDSGDNDTSSAPETTAEPPLAASTCINNAQPCSLVNSKDGIVSCRLRTSVCGVDLDNIVSQVGNGVTENTAMWIQAWGGKGGNSDKACDGGDGGYAQTTTSVSDIKSYTGSAQLFYYVASGGKNGGNHCGSAGGSATIVTLEDLLPLDDQGPSLASPPTLLVAGGGGGGSAGNGTFPTCGVKCLGNGGRGGIAIASTSSNGTGSGDSVDSSHPMGGHLGVGGYSSCDVCSSGNETGGRAAFGGRGGAGGSGQSCSGPGSPTWTNTGSTTLKMTSGEGGKGSSNTKLCDAGGGGGGGGWGGGGGGGHGNDAGHSIAGGGGGSFAIISTRSSTSAPKSRPGNPCSNTSNGCVQIEFKP